MGKRTYYKEQDLIKVIKDNNIKTRSEIRILSESMHYFFTKKENRHLIEKHLPIQDRGYSKQDLIKVIKDNNIKTRSELKQHDITIFRYFKKKKREHILDDLLPQTYKREFNDRLIYQITFSDGAIYIGSTTKTIQKRLKEHIYDNCTFSRYIKKHNVTAIIEEIIPYTNHILAIEREHKIIRSLKDLNYNCINYNDYPSGWYSANRNVYYPLKQLLDAIKKDNIKSKADLTKLHSAMCDWYKNHHRGILDRYLPNVRNQGGYTKKQFLDYIKANNITVRSHLEDKHSGMYSWVYHNKIQWLEKHLPLSYNYNYTKQDLIDAIKKDNIKSKAELKMKYSALKTWFESHDKETLDKLLPNTLNINGYTEQDLIDAKKAGILTKTELGDYDGGLYSWFRKNDKETLDKLLPNVRNRNGNTKINKNKK